MKQIPFYSKRNQVYPTLWHGHPAVKKYFVQIDDWRRESELYTELNGKLPLPKIFSLRPGLLVLEYRREPTMLDEIDRQERQGFDSAPWRALAVWLRKCFSLCGQVPEDGNLRNFLWDSSSRHVIGLDLECYQPDTLELCGARLAASILTYWPYHTVVKRQAAGVIADELDVPKTLIAEALDVLHTRRQSQQTRSLSGIILAGGRSRRMGQNKAGLVLMGKTLLEHQIHKLQALGISDIMLSGAGCPNLPGLRVIPDEYGGMGPLGGLHACLRTAENSACLVMSVDTPLIPTSALAHLCRAHKDHITVLRHGGWEEPLLGVYDRCVADFIPALLEDGKYAVRALQNIVSWGYFDYLGPEELLMNCNTPEDFDAAKRFVQSLKYFYPQQEDGHLSGLLHGPGSLR